MAHKLNKTQARIMAAIKSRGSYGFCCGVGRGPDGGALKWGSRNRDALHGLLGLGLVRIKHRDRGLECMGNGNNVMVTSYHVVAADKHSEGCSHTA